MLFTSSLRRFLLTVSCLSLALIASAAEPARRPLSPADFDAWRSIVSPALSRDGRWLAYTYMPQDGDGDLVIRELSTGREFRQPVGAQPPPAFPLPTSVTERQPPAPTVGLLFTSDNAFLLSTPFPAKAEQAAARQPGAKPADAPKRPLLITRLSTGETTRIAAVKNVQVPARGGSWAAWLLEPAPTAATPATAPEKPQNPPGTELVLRNLATGAQRTFAYVTEYSFARDGRTLLFAVSAPDPRDNGLFAVTPGDSAPPRPLLAGAGRYIKITWDRAQTKAAFLSDRDDASSEAPRFKAWLWTRDQRIAAAVIAADTAGMPEGMTVSEKAAPEFSLDGAKLYVGVAPFPRVPPRASIDSEDRVTADLWSWTDDLIQPRQEVRASLERDRTYRGVFDLATRRYTQLADPAVAEVSLSDDGTRALGFDYRPYYRLRDFDGTYGDIYIIDAATGQRRLAIQKLRGRSGDEGAPAIALSPDGRHAAYFSDRQWRVLDTTTGGTRDLTSALPFAFQDENHDQPEPPPAYGWAGWTSDSQSLLIYDRYDVWQVFPDGRAPRDLTHGTGRAAKIAFRVQDIAAHEEDDPSRGLDPAAPLILRGESEETRATGYYRTSFAADAAPVRLIWGDKDYRYTGRALAADVLMLIASRFDEFPDVQITDASFAAPKKVTDGAAQLAPFRWGSAELVNFRNTDGVPLQALLYKPADFDPKKKYPLIVYTYERLSTILHRFFPPSFGANISFPFYASNGYLVLLPDIAYTIGHPGRSALNAVMPALDAVIARGYVDENALGIQGSSWGGYQSAYLITQTHRFRAAEAGAVVGNMTSAYAGIRWISGQPRLFQYEQSQSRIGPPLTDAPELYLENSPVFHVKNVQTPLLILHNDRDGAVPWYQAIELFLALRRHDKPVWFFNYHDEGHGLTRRADQRDYSRRMWQFFEHYLRGAPAPDWLREGIPYIERDQEKRRFDAQPWSTP